jgi:hypothetical protein
VEKSVRLLAMKRRKAVRRRREATETKQMRLKSWREGDEKIAG